ncbi:MAG: hypothetical protein NTY33_04805 [Candidatus Moranbacteria bacterium]|nr:hypothetical protein [Candidatus Moranbacteria bacterium]
MAEGEVFLVVDNKINPSEKEKQMKLKCSYCEKDLGKKEGNAVITHGACPECEKKANEEIDRFPIFKQK